MPPNRAPVHLLLSDEDQYPCLWVDCSCCGREGEWYPEDGVVEHIGMDPCTVQVRYQVTVVAA